MSGQCGTYAGWNAHKRQGEPVCDGCREAARLYQKAWRLRGGDAQDGERARNRAATRALWRLKDLFPTEFDILYADELRIERRAARKKAAS